MEPLDSQSGKECCSTKAGADEPRRRPSDWQVFVQFVTANWRRILRFTVLAAGACILMLLWLENSLIFPAPKYDPRDGWNAAAYGAEDVWFNSGDGTQLHGWYFHQPEPQAYMLYCHGNGDCVAYHDEFGDPGDPAPAPVEDEETETEIVIDPGEE